MAASLRCAIIALFLLTAGCGAPAPQIKRIVLFAPFESTYREIGYDALYPVKLAFADEGQPDIQLLSVDDSGSAEGGVLRAQALAADPTVVLALVTGPIATDQRVLDALADMPVIVIGEWSVTPEEAVFVLTAEAIAAQLTSQGSSVYEAANLSEAAGGALFGIKAYAALSQDTSNITILASAAPPSSEFRERLLASDLYVPEPGLLATAAYDAGTLAARVVAEAASRADALEALRSISIEGINGEIRFDNNGYWADAPIYKYQYNGNHLTLAES